MTVAEQEQAIKDQDRRIRLATAAYCAVWDSWSGLDARSVHICRRAAMAAALAAAEGRPQTVDEIVHGLPPEHRAKIATRAQQLIAEETAAVIVRRLTFAVAQLRHAYTHLKVRSVTQQEEFADGLIAPQIECIEKIIREVQTDA